MKAILTVLIVVVSQYVALGQKKNSLFVDVSCNYLGGSATYDRKLTRHFDAGLGMNIYNYNSQPYANMRSALYADFRPNWAIRRSLLFLFVDAGVAYKGGREPVNGTFDPFGLFTALGFGYCYHINKRGMGPYVSAGMYGNSLSYHSNNISLPASARDYSVFEATLLLSLGFKI